jgi:ATP adenylyltransferase
MDHLWSPWRYRYVSTAEPSSACIFCAKSQENRDADNLILYRGLRNFILLNLFPYTSGHLMIAPYDHVATLAEADEDTVTEMMLLTRASQARLYDVYRAPGFNAGMNIGAAAGAGVPGHIHMHVLPRWTGDVNFMTTVAETRVIPEAIEETYRKLSAAFANLA